MSDSYAPPDVLRSPAELFAELGHTLKAAGDRLREAGDGEAASRYSQAAQAFKDALDEHTRATGRGSSELLLYLAELRQLQSRQAEALSAYLEAVCLDPTVAARALPPAHKLLTRDLARSLAERETGLAEAVADPGLDPENRSAVFNFLGRLSFYRQDYQGAVERFQRALAENPDSIYIREGLSEALWQTGQAEGAAAVMLEAVKHANARGLPDRMGDARLKLAQTLQALGRWQEAQRVIEDGLHLWPPLAADFQILLGKGYLALGHPEAALQAAGQALAAPGLSDGQRAAALTVRAAALVDVRQYPAAAQAAESALRLDPSYLEATRVRALALIAGEIDREAGIRLLQYYTGQRPEDSDSQLLLARSLRAAGRPEADTLHSLKVALPAAAPASRAALLLEMADSHLRLGEPHAALKDLEAAADLDPHTGGDRWWGLFAGALLDTDQARQARQAYEKALKKYPASPLLLEGYAQLLESLDEKERASAAWQQLLTINPNNPTGLLRLGRLLLELGNTDQALAVVEQALDQPADGDRLAAAYRLKGEILTARREPAAAAAAFYEAGIQLNARNDYPAADALLDQALAQDPNHAPALWLSAENLRRWADITADPAEQAALLERALELWERGLALRTPDAASSWAYTTRALINLTHFHLQEQELWWQAAVFLERALLLDENQSLPWAGLGHFYRMLRLVSNSQHVTDRALKLNPQDLYALDTRVSLLVDLSEPQEAQELLDRRLGIGRDAWTDYIQAYIYLQLGRYREVIERLAEETEDTYRLNVLAIAHRMAGSRDDSRRVYGRLFERYTPEGRDDWSNCAQAAFFLGLFGQPERFADAARIFTPLLERPWEASLANEFLGLIDLVSAAAGAPTETEAAGRVETGERRIVAAIGLAVSVREVDELLEFDLAEVERSLTEEGRAALAGPIERIRAVAGARRAELERRPTLAAELADAGEGWREKWAWAGVQAGLARVFTTAGRWQEAAQAYQRLAEADADAETEAAGEGDRPVAPTSEGTARFPEARLGLDRCVAGLQAEGDRHMRAERFAAARIQYEEALQTAEGIPGFELKRLAELHSRRAVAVFSLVGDEGASEPFAAAIRLYRQSGHPEPGRAVGEAALPLIAGLDHLWALQANAGALKDRPDLNATLLAELGAAQRALLSYLDDAFGLAEAPGADRFPAVAAVTLALDSRLIPYDTDPQSWPLFSAYIPAMRKRVQDELGLELPGVRVRAEDFPVPGQYRILLGNAPAAVGLAPPEHIFCQAGIETLLERGFPAEALQPADHPLTGRPGCWLPDGHAPRLTALGLIFSSDPLLYITHHLEAVLRRSLPYFWGVQETQTALNALKSDEELGQIAADLLSNPSGLVCLRRVFSTLLREGVPVTRPGDILAAVAETGLSSDPAAAVAAARLRLRDLLPGNEITWRQTPGAAWERAPGEIQGQTSNADGGLPAGGGLAAAVEGAGPARFIELDAGLEASLRPFLVEAGGRRFFAPPAVEAEAWLAALEPLAGPDGRGRVLVVSSGDLRPAVRRLVEAKFPHLIVLAREEVLEWKSATPTAQPTAAPPPPSA